MAFLITPNGDCTKIEPKEGKHFCLAELCQQIECGRVEVCDANTEGEILIFDEECLLRNEYKLNKLATGEMHPKMLPFSHNVIAGNAILCKNEQFA